MNRKLLEIFRRIPPYQPTLVVFVIILYLTILPKPFEDDNITLFPGADKLVHACMFGGLAITYFFDRFRSKKILNMQGALIVSLIVSITGTAIELVQQWMDAGRSGDIYDAIADTIGAFAAIPLAAWLHWVHVVVKHGSR